MIDDRVEIVEMLDIWPVGARPPAMLGEEGLDAWLAAFEKDVQGFVERRFKR